MSEEVNFQKLDYVQKIWNTKNRRIFCMPHIETSTGQNADLDIEKLKQQK